MDRLFLDMMNTGHKVIRAVSDPNQLAQLSDGPFEDITNIGDRRLTLPSNLRPSLHADSFRRKYEFCKDRFDVYKDMSDEMRNHTGFTSHRIYYEACLARAKHIFEACNE